MQYFVKRKADGWYYVTAFMGATQWNPERNRAWGIEVKIYADIIAERLTQEGEPAEVEPA